MPATWPTRSAGSSDVFEPSGRGPLASVNFVTAHDGFTLRDLVSYDHKHNERQRRGRPRRVGPQPVAGTAVSRARPTTPTCWRCARRLSRNLLATLLLSAGVPMLTAGDETGRTQGGNNNAYCLDDETTWVSWEHEPWQRDLYGWTRTLLALRREHPSLRHGALLRRSSGARGRARRRPRLVRRGRRADDGRAVVRPRPADHRHVPRRPAATASLLCCSTPGRPSRPCVLPGTPWAAGYEALLDTADEQPTASEPLTHDAGDVRPGLAARTPRSLLTGTPSDCAHDDRRLAQDAAVHAGTLDRQGGQAELAGPGGEPVPRHDPRGVAERPGPVELDLADVAVPAALVGLVVLQRQVAESASRSASSTRP